MTYYKATSLDGTDFYTGTINYAKALVEGNTIEHPGPDTNAGARGYLSVATTPTDCTGMLWPCRLFEVEPENPWGTTDFKNKRACFSLNVVRELPSHLTLGPQGEQLESLFKVFDDWSNIKRLNDSYVHVKSNAFYYERSTTEDLAHHSSKSNNRAAAWWTVCEYTIEAFRGCSVRPGLKSVILNAATGLLVRDLIDTESYNVLTEDWRYYVGPIHPGDPDWYWYETTQHSTT